ncbi:MAG TPA: 30S ribosomal protein S16 [Cyclobacteriaceae bacterium]
MPVKIRLSRRGRKKSALFDVIIADSRSPRDGRFIERIGHYNPKTDPATVDLDEEKAFDWLMKGAQPTDTARAILSYRGVLLRKHLQVGVNKGAITQDEADAKLNEWKEAKQSKIQEKIDTLSKEKGDKLKARLAAETKIREARAESLKKKNVVEEPAPEESAEKEPPQE